LYLIHFHVPPERFKVNGVKKFFACSAREHVLCAFKMVMPPLGLLRSPNDLPVS